MQHIAAALGALDDPARARVLDWAAQRFRGELPAAQAPSPQVATPWPASVKPGGPVDEALSVSTLGDLFVPNVEAEPTPSAAGAEAPVQPVTGMLHDFVVEFQSIARDWNVACADPTDGTERQRASSAV